MTTALQTFHTEFGEHQAQLTIIDVRGEPWFKGKEAAAALGYKNLNQAISNKVECEDKDNLENLGGLVTRPLTNPNEGACIYISESGLYSLIMGSRLPHAKAFKRWVLREVLPSIRRTGQFSTLQELPAHWEAHRAKLDALASAQALAHAAGVPLGGGHQKAISDAVHAVLLPAGRQQEDMIDAAEFLRRKGHAQEEIRRLASQFGKALKAAWTHTRNDQVVTNCRNGPGANDVRMYHAKDDAIFLDEVYNHFRAHRNLYAAACGGHEQVRAQTAQSVASAFSRSLVQNPNSQFKGETVSIATHPPSPRGPGGARRQPSQLHSGCLSNRSHSPS